MMMEDRGIMDRTLYLRNFDDRVTEDIFKELFIQAMGSWLRLKEVDTVYIESASGGTSR